MSGRRVDLNQVSSALDEGTFLPVLVDPEASSLARLRPAVVVDGRMAKRNLGTSRNDARLVIALGPGFVAGRDVHAVVETQRGPDLGRVRWTGGAEADTMIPGAVHGYAERRVIRRKGSRWPAGFTGLTSARSSGARRTLPSTASNGSLRR